ncbi:MAG: GNAT family N-acetyltransferase [Lachnospiraceae bacterium]|nr:GNAT family N-acetyltransferase [Lachnospiraceae bacterium]
MRKRMNTPAVCAWWGLIMDISTAGSLDKNFILDLYQEAFPEQERKPFSLIERKAAMGEMEMLLIREEKKRIGFAIVAYGERLVLLDYFAISPRWRGQGYGSAALELIQGLYSDRPLFLEIEKPLTADTESSDGQAGGMDPEEKEGASDIRQRRKAFYLRNGMLETGVQVELFGVKMELLSTVPGLTFEDCEPLYRSLLGPIYRNLIKQI